MRNRLAGVPVLFCALLLVACQFPGLPDGPTVVTPEGSSSAIAVYFTAPGERNQPASLERDLIRAINSAESTIDVAMYNFSLQSVERALVAAQRRGVTVRVLVDSDALDNRAVQRLLASGTGVVTDRREGLMHHKFVVIDRQIVWTGSLNLTPSGLSKDDNLMLRLESAQLAQIFTAEFEEMFVFDRFGEGDPLSNGEGEVRVGDIPLEVLFAPEDRPSRRILDLIRSADTSVSFLAYNLTQNDLRDALIAAEQAGVMVRGVFDADQITSTGSDYEALLRAGLDVRLDGIDGLMHHKVIVIDGEIVITGSYNFTRSADEVNDECVLILYDPALALEFQREFERIYNSSQK